MQAWSDGQSLDDGVTWKPVIGFAGRYEAGDNGQIKSLLTHRILRPGRTSRGYMSIGLYVDVVPKHVESHLVHRIVWIAFNGPIDAGKQINHIDGDKTNNRLNNLECVTQSENMMHAVGHTNIRRYKAQEHANAKLTERDVWQIRQAATTLGIGYKALARAFRVSDKTIANVVTGETYAEIV